MKSFKDKKGKLYVDCSECERGGNGIDKDKCSCGWKITKSDGRGCFLGTLIPEGELEKRIADRPKVSKSKMRYQMYLRSETTEDFIDWLKNGYWDNYRKQAGCF